MLLTAAMVPAATAEADASSRVAIAILPSGTSVSEIAAADPALAPGLLSPALGFAPADQTYLDISQGNRVFTSLYPAPLPLLKARRGSLADERWEVTLERALEAPADIIPGLLAETLGSGEIPIVAERGTGDPALIGVDLDGEIEFAEGCELGTCPGVTIGRARASGLSDLVSKLRGDDILIAFERPPPTGRLMSVGIAGRGFDGALRSMTTRIDGYVLSTDIAPTVLERVGIEAPEEMTGRPIESTGSAGPAELDRLEGRLQVVSLRRGPVIGTNLIVWSVLALLAGVFGGRRWARPVVGLLGISIALLPALLLFTAGLYPSELVERLVIGLGAPGLAAAAWLALRPRLAERAALGAFAIAAGLSVVGYAVDVVAGSPLTSLSLIGPNPVIGVRFFGIGNELEASIGALLALGPAAAVAALRPSNPCRVVSIAAAVAALAGVLVFAPGRFGADVGAAITFPAGAVGVIIATGVGRRRAALLVLAPIAAVAMLVAIDLTAGGDAHLSRTVLEAGGLDGIGQVVERRTRLSASSFTRFISSPYFLAALLLAVGAVVYRDRLRGWMAGRPAARAGLVGALVAVAVGTLANDSGALLLMVGIAFCAAFVAVCWVVGPAGAATSEPEPGEA